jgi:hypothetical protein
MFFKVLKCSKLITRWDQARSPEALKPRKIVIDGGANVQALEQRQAA